jgi:hypothetical protein
MGHVSPKRVWKGNTRDALFSIYTPSVSHGMGMGVEK